jgi:hypothetical protein
MPTGNSLYQRKPGRLAGEKKKFRNLVEKLKKLSSEHGYTKKQIADELGAARRAIRGEQAWLNEEAMFRHWFQAAQKVMPSCSRSGARPSSDGGAESE